MADVKNAMQDEENIIPQADYASKEGILIFFLLAMVVLVIEANILYALSLGSIGVGIVFLVHFFVLVLIGVITWWHHSRKGDVRMPMILLVLVTVSGIFGAGIFLLCEVTYLFFSRYSMSFINWLKILFPTEEVSEGIKLYERIVDGLDDISDEEEVEPFFNIIAYGSLRQKQLVLAKITRYFQPGFAPALLQGLQDPDNAVRVQAATAMARIEKKFSAQFSRMQRETDKHPENIKTMVMFASLCDEYAHSGILDKDREQQSRLKAIELYERAISLTPFEKDDDLRLSLGRLYSRNNEISKAQECLKKCFEKGRPVPANIVMWYMEVLFEMQRFDEVRSLAKQYMKELAMDQSPQSKRVTDVLGLWEKGVGDDGLVVGR